MIRLLQLRLRISSTGIPSPPLALFIAMLSKAHLTSHSRMSGSRPGMVTVMLQKPNQHLSSTKIMLLKNKGGEKKEKS
ncbi:hypothetical protein CapIbe_004406 [Capra ibex]